MVQEYRAHILRQLIQRLNNDKPIVILVRNGLSLCVSLFSLSFHPELVLSCLINELTAGG